MSTPRFRPMRFGVTRVTLRDGAPGTHYLRAEQELGDWAEVVRIARLLESVPACRPPHSRAS